MKSLQDQDHYQLLEVARDASEDEIERAYRVVSETYESESLALYSVFGARDAAVIRERVEDAYRVLSDPEQREAYDRALLQTDALQREARGREPADAASVPHSHQAQLEQLEGVSDAFREMEADVEEGAGDFDGAMLRRARLRRGFELDQISSITKVSMTNLRHIEEENFDALPATVYVRGFVTAYARTIGLDPARVVAGYLGRLESVRGDHARGRFLGRR